MSDNERPEVTAFRELDQLVRHLGDELANFRRRALHAESQLRSIEALGGAVSVAERRRLEMLEAENMTLRRRMERAAGRVSAMLERVRFLRQQGGLTTPGGSAARAEGAGRAARGGGEVEETGE